MNKSQDGVRNLYEYVGPPGCGKTETLKRSVAMNAGIYGASKIMCCSLTVNAAGVLRGRIDLPQQNVGTLHSFCYRELGCPELTVKHEKEFSQEFPRFAFSASQASVDDLYSDSARESDGDRIRALVDVCRARKLPKESWHKAIQHTNYNISALLLFHERWTEWKKANELMDFTDLLERCQSDIETAPGMPAVIIGDEAQDWSRLALDLLLKWGRNAAKMILAGDGNQAIFQFAGADTKTFLALPVPDANKAILGQSYRLPAIPHAVAQKWLQKASVRQEAAFAPRLEKDGTTAQGFVQRSKHSLATNCHKICEEAAGFVEQGKTVMLIASCSFHVDRFIRSLREVGLPFHNPLRPKDGSWNPLRHGSMADRARAFLAPLETRRMWSKGQAAQFLEILPADGYWRRGLKDSTLKLWKKNDAPASTDDLRSVLENKFCDRLFSLFEDDDEDLSSRLLRWLADAASGRFKNKLDYAASVVMNHGTEALGEEPKITVGTIHSLKGAEADVTFVAPDLSYAAYREWGNKSEERDEIVRCFYVALTRCREGMFVLQPSTNMHVKVDL